MRAPSVAKERRVIYFHGGSTFAFEASSVQEKRENFARPRGKNTFCPSSKLSFKPFLLPQRKERERERENRASRERKTIAIIWPAK